jgi:hypothetical protein
VSSEASGIEVDIDAAIDPDSDSDAGIVNGALLLRFATAAQQRTDDLPASRLALMNALGEEGVVEAAATIAIFNGLVRVADGTGIQLDDGVLADSSDFRDRLGVSKFDGAEKSTSVVAPTRIDGVAELFGSSTR